MSELYDGQKKNTAGGINKRTRGTIEAYSNIKILNGVLKSEQ